MFSIRRLNLSPAALLPWLVSASLSAAPIDQDNSRSPARPAADSPRASDPAAGQQGITKFSDGTAGLSPRFYSNTSLFDGQFTGICVGDYDNDDDEDLYFTNNGNPATRPYFMAGMLPPDDRPTNLDNPAGQGRPNALYRNEGVAGGIVRFTNVAAEAGVEDAIGIGSGCVFADFDNDGDLDLYVANKLKGITFSEFGFHSVEQNVDFKGFRDGGTGAPLFAYDTERGQRNGEWVVLTDPATGRPRGEGRNTLFKNLLVETGQPRFEDVTDQAGEVGGTPSTRPGGDYSTTVAVADVNGDGHLDLFVGNFIDQDFWNTKGVANPQGQRGDGENLHSNGEKNRLYLNRGDLTFTDVTDEAGLGGPVPYFYDYDGSRHESHNADLRDVDGNPVGEPAMLTWGVNFFDFNHDARPDILVANDVPGTIVLYRNDSERGGPPRFTDITRESGLDLIGEWMGFSLADFDRDGDLDVFCANFGGNIYSVTHNTDLARRTLADDVGEWNRWQQNASVHGLFRHDGVRRVRKDGVEQEAGIFPNVIQTVHLRQSRWMPMLTSDPTQVSPQKRVLYGLAPMEFVWGSVAFDYDNDTWPDLYTIGSLGQLMENPGRLIRNLGGWRFEDVSVEAHALDIQLVNYERVDRGEPPAPGDRLEWTKDSLSNEKGGAVAYADLDRNGFADLIVSNTGSYESQLPDVPTYPNGSKVFRPGPTFLYLNQGNAHHWLQIRLRGAMRGRSAAALNGEAPRTPAGARVVVTLDTERGAARLVRELTLGGGFQSQNSEWLHFGLGEADRARKIEVFWPWGGKDELFEVRADQHLTIEQKAVVAAKR